MPSRGSLRSHSVPLTGASNNGGGGGGGSEAFWAGEWRKAEAVWQEGALVEVVVEVIKCQPASHTAILSFHGNQASLCFVGIGYSFRWSSDISLKPLMLVLIYHPNLCGLTFTCVQAVVRTQQGASMVILVLELEG